MRYESSAPAGGDAGSPASDRASEQQRIVMPASCHDAGQTRVCQPLREATNDPASYSGLGGLEPVALTCAGDLPTQETEVGLRRITPAGPSSFGLPAPKPLQVNRSRGAGQAGSQALTRSSLAKRANPASSICPLFEDALFGSRNPATVSADRQVAMSNLAVGLTTPRKTETFATDAVADQSTDRHINLLVRAANAAVAANNDSTAGSRTPSVRKTDSELGSRFGPMLATKAGRTAVISSRSCGQLPTTPATRRTGVLESVADSTSTPLLRPGSNPGPLRRQVNLSAAPTDTLSALAALTSLSAASELATRRSPRSLKVQLPFVFLITFPFTLSCSI
ncbi:unnamed protein product [Protopolystoma xenopodis]|uniref:Uncharacterized protein n=1 Tax=Protopolystoma xenopodis TaxID=117903 RepID=A0A3S5B1M3_9PLAT|nr:unnamed protein product [Protopolystoma xenopodis]